MATDFYSGRASASFLRQLLGSLKVEKRLSQLELTNFDPSESRALERGTGEQ